MSPISLSTIASLLAFTSYVSAHGFPTSVVIDGQTYPGSNGANASSSSPIRKVSSGSPVTDLQSNDIICGASSPPASSMATAQPGSLLQFYWSGETGIPWFHNAGPIQTFMAQCDGDCTSFTPSSSTEWFKISELGEKEPGTPDTWVQADLNSGAPVNITMPSNIAAGNYLMRHEIIALQNAQSTGGAEFYPNCLQVTVQGSQTGTPNSTVNFPGAYSPTDPGILGNFYNPGVVYVFPGGPVSNLRDPLSDTDDSVGGGSSLVADHKTSSTTHTSSAVAKPSTQNAVVEPTSTSIPPSCDSDNSSSNSRRSTLQAESYQAIEQKGVRMHRKRRLSSH